MKLLEKFYPIEESMETLSDNLKDAIRDGTYAELKDLHLQKQTAAYDRAITLLPISCEW